jgi:hypothetical protein
VKGRRLYGRGRRSTVANHEGSLTEEACLVGTGVQQFALTDEEREG